MKTLNKLKSLVFSPAAAPVVIVAIGILMHASFSVAASGNQIVLGGSIAQSQAEQGIFHGEAVAVNPIGSDVDEMGIDAESAVETSGDSVSTGGIFGYIKPIQQTIGIAAPLTAAAHCNLDGYWPTGFGRPAAGPVGSRHGHIDQFTGLPIAVDIPNKLGTTVVAAGAGTVVRAAYGWNGGYGNVIEIDHGQGLRTLYSHFQDILVAVGDYKAKGDPIGFMGETGNATGPHVHFEVRCNYN